ncbi:MAG: glycosyltransferase family 2 protein [Lachnospiraceae bacterium]|nr:glycosyltransferase family 2 protein [Lachnospiraceae bacterium]
MKISIIVPVYNCEMYLRACVNSLIDQSYQNIEIILVNDGSTDRSASICDEYSCKDDRVKVLHKDNAGVSSARNTGLKASTGDYITFVDSDDWLDRDACSKIVDELDGKSVLYIWNLRKCIGDVVEVQQDIHKPASIQELASDIIACPKYQNYYIRAVWAKVYKRELVNDLVFPENIYIGEDACFLLECLKRISNVHQIKVIEDTWYNYRIIQTSAVRKYKKDLLWQSIAQYEYITAYISDVKIENVRSITTAMTMFCWCVFITLKKNELKSQKRSRECLRWAQLTIKYLKNSKIETKKLSKFMLLCWRLCRIVNMTIMEDLVGLYVRYERRKKN